MSEMTNDEMKKEIEEFLIEPDLQLQNIETTNSIKTNFFISQQNFQDILKYLKKLKKFLGYLFEMIDIPAIVQKVIKWLESNKTIISIPYTQEIGSVVIQKQNGRNYQIKRIDKYIIEITNLTEESWVTDRLQVTVKDDKGTFVYPTITTKNSKITVHFIDEIMTNYDLFFM